MPFSATLNGTCVNNFLNGAGMTKNMAANAV